MSVMSEDELSTGHDASKQCRICLDNDDLNDIISPCLCSGGSAYVHRKCLNNWRSENANGKAFKFCDICQFEYIIETIVSDPKAERERLLKYHYFVIRDLSLITLALQSVIFAFAFLLKRIDRNSGNIKNVFPAFINGFLVYYLSGFILLLVILGIIAFIFIGYLYITRGNTSSNNHRSTSSTSSRGSSNNANTVAGTMIAMIIICAVVGLSVGAILSVIILRKIMKNHNNKLWLRQEAEKYIVKDFTERRRELEKYTRNNRNPPQSLSLLTANDSAQN